MLTLDPEKNLSGECWLRNKRPHSLVKLMNPESYESRKETNIFEEPNMYKELYILNLI